MDVVDPEQAAGSLLFASLLVLVVFFIALRAGYFRLPPLTTRDPVTFWQTVGVFLTYFLLIFLILPLINAGFMSLVSKKRINLQQWLGWAQIIALFIVFISLIIYCFLVKREARYYVFWGGREPSAKRFRRSVLMGFVTFIVSYPFVFWTGIVTSMISLWIWGEAKLEQVAVRQLKMTMGSPAMFGLMIVFVVFLVPFMEELLFRGFLQSFLKRHIGRMWGLFLTAIIFALFHYAHSQGTGNFQLIFSIFVLAIFLGFIYERQQTLWASMTLHASFNAFSVIMIAFSD